MKLNIDWHFQNNFGRNAPFEEKIKWHKNHLVHCGCKKTASEIDFELYKRTLKKDP